MNHTPTPWYPNGKLILGATPDMGQIGGCHDEADTEFVVRAVNAHEELERRNTALELELARTRSVCRSAIAIVEYAIAQFESDFRNDPSDENRQVVEMAYEELALLKSCMPQKKENHTDEAES